MDNKCAACGKMFAPKRQGVGRGMYCSLTCQRQRNTKPLAQRFWAQVEQTPNCWEWQGGCTKAGYGQIGEGGKHGRKLYAHRLSWEYANSKTLPPGAVVRHQCDNPPCVNPDHLVIGTTAENMADKVNRGRQRKGETHPTSKLSDVEVARIRLLAKNGLTQSEIAKVYSVGQSAISLLINHKRR